MRLGPIALRTCRLEFVCTPESLQVLEPLFGGFVLLASLTQSRLRFVDVLLGDGTLFRERLTALEYLLLGVQCVLRGGDVELCFLQFLWNGRLRGVLEGSFRLVECGAAFGRSACEVLVLQLDEQLSCANTLPALNAPPPHRSGNLGNDRRLLFGVDQAIRPDRLLNLRQQHWRDVDRDNGLGLC